MTGVPRRILLVDDDIAQVAAVKRVLMRAGYEPVLATNASDARATLASARPELVVVASRCEGGEGLVLARELGGGEVTQDIPLVLIGEGEVAGAAARLEEPVDPEALEAAVEKALPRHALGRDGEKPEERRSAAEALRARAEELRRSSPALSALAEKTSPLRPPPQKTVVEGLARQHLVPPRMAAALAEGIRPVAASVARPPRPEAAASPAGEIRPPDEVAVRSNPVPAVGIPAAGQGWFEAEALPEPPPAPLQVEDFARVDAERKAARGEQRGSKGERDDPSPALQRSAAQEAAEELRLAAQAATQASDAEGLRRQAEAEVRRRAGTASFPPPREGKNLDGPASSPEEDKTRGTLEVEAARQAEVARRRVILAARQRQVLAPSRAEGEGPAGPPPAELLAGTLANCSIARLLALAVRSRVRGRLEVGNPGPEARSVWFEGGRVVGAKSGVEGEHCEDVALRLGLIGREQHRLIALTAVGLPSRRVGVLLLERGLLKPSELVLLARSAAKEVVFATFAAEGRYRFVPDEPVPADERVSIDRSTLALAVDGVRRRWTRARLDAVLGGGSTLLAPAAGAPPPVELALSPDEARLASLANGLRTLDEVLGDSPLDPLSSRQALAALVEVGALAVKAREPVEEPSAVPSALDLARVDERLDLVRRADYFAILGLGRGCTPYEIRQAAERLLEELVEERFGSSAVEGLSAKLGEIRQVIEEARDILCDDALRAEYVAALGGEGGEVPPRVASESGNR